MAGDDPGATLAESGEFAVIDRLVAGRRQPPGVSLGPGDDAAVVAAADGRVAVCTDMLIQDRHFRLDWSTPYDVGRKAIAQNAADIEAMGGRCTAFVVGFGAPGDTATAQAVELADGMWHEADLVGAGIVGGDMVSAPQWVISVAALGDLEGRDPVRRGGAGRGDTVAVTGDLGRSEAGYTLWHNGIRGFEALRRRHLVPEPPYGQGRAAALAGATSMTDVSDGLLADLGHIAAASGLDVDLSWDGLHGDIDAVTDAAAAVGADPRQWVLGGGEDHALVATFPASPPPGWRPIGRVVGVGDGRVTVDGAAWAGTPGWQSY
ncbi:thiamine-phosphate kinase [Mycolicibacterium chubuense NBB4]|uniref:Thiamine-monophosphate kinase n=1 Tax=Mycolicibacterium chubuense (strain NBB4) TaxID=710421 RepID=I4BH94_MYCCN|nr:thiamine-phosphate kinase [Mycolicibacterium chubuense]AFM16651.1 thiamine-phosphate kinase [Mycolicibacterium chubuense NBB4]